MRHELAVDRVSMTYSWHNVNAGYNNNTIKYSPDNGTKWKTITFVDGMYSYDDLDDYITQSIIQNGDKPSSSKGINLYFVLSSYRVVIELDNQWKLDIRNSNFGALIGFEPKLINQTEHGTKLPNITNDIDVLNINCDIITDSLSDGRFTNTLIMIPTDNLTRSYPFTFEPKKSIIQPSFQINYFRNGITLTDALVRPIDLNGIDWFMS